MADIPVQNLVHREVLNAVRDIAGATQILLKWDYCSIVDIDVFHKAEASRCKDEGKPDGSCKDLKATWKQPDKFSYVGKCKDKKKINF